MASAVGLSFWTLLLGVGVSLGWTVRQLAVLLAGCRVTHAVILVGWQWLLLAVLATGWGALLVRVLRPRPAGRFTWLYASIGGGVLAMVVMQNLAYLDVRVSWSAWGCLAVAVGGLIAARGGVAWPYRRRDLVATIAVGACVGAIHTWPVIQDGPEHYYGRGHADQYVYVATAQFLSDQPFSRGYASVGFEPWMVPAISAKGQRIGQSVVMGAVAVLSGSTSQIAYGATSIAFLALLAMSAFALARTVSLGRITSTLVALWIGLLPGITGIHLDGFLSNVAALFAFPAMCGVLAGRRRIEAFEVVVSILIIAWVLSCYSELIPLALLNAIALIAVHRRTSLMGRVSIAAIVMTAPWVLFGGYAASAVRFLILQYGVGIGPSGLDGLFPKAGTLGGWGEIFVRSAFLQGIVQRRADLSRLVAMTMLALGFAALLRGSVDRRRHLAACAVAPAVFLAALLVRPQFGQYAFGKLSVTFGWLWCLLAAIGVTVLPGRSRSRRTARFAGAGMTGILAVGAAWSTTADLASLRAPTSILGTIDSTAARESYLVAETQPNRSFVIRERHNIAAAWLAYHARHARTYFDADLIAHVVVPADQFAFRRLPDTLTNEIILSAAGPRDLRTYDGPPDLTVANPQGTEGGGVTTWYWLGGTLTIEVTRYGPSAPRDYNLSFTAQAGPANPRQDRVLELIDAGGRRQAFRFDTSAVLTAPLTLEAGKSVLTLRVVSPTEQLVKILGDPRKHMVAISGLAIAYAR